VRWTAAPVVVGTAQLAVQLTEPSAEVTVPCPVTDTVSVAAPVPPPPLPVPVPGFDELPPHATNAAANTTPPQFNRVIGPPKWVEGNFGTWVLGGNGKKCSNETRNGILGAYRPSHSSCLPGERTSLIAEAPPINAQAAAVALTCIAFAPLLAMGNAFGQRKG
jgi:hypothetical protein